MSAEPSVDSPTPLSPDDEIADVILASLARGEMIGNGQAQPLAGRLARSLLAARSEVVALRTALAELANYDEGCIAHGPECEHGCLFCETPWPYDWKNGTRIEKHADNCDLVAARAVLSSTEGAK